MRSGLLPCPLLTPSLASCAEYLRQSRGTNLYRDFVSTRYEPSSSFTPAVKEKSRDTGYAERKESDDLSTPPPGTSNFEFRVWNSPTAKRFLDRGVKLIHSKVYGVRVDATAIYSTAGADVYLHGAGSRDVGCGNCGCKLLRGYKRGGSDCAIPIDHRVTSKPGAVDGQSERRRVVGEILFRSIQKVSTARHFVLIFLFI